jgi:hypothetical protein
MLSSTRVGCRRCRPRHQRQFRGDDCEQLVSACQAAEALFTPKPKVVQQPDFDPRGSYNTTGPISVKQFELELRRKAVARPGDQGRNGNMGREATLDVSGTFSGEAIRLLILFAAQQARSRDIASRSSRCRAWPRWSAVRKPMPWAEIGDQIVNILERRLAAMRAELENSAPDTTGKTDDRP